MGSLNLYKIESDKRDEFIRMLSSKLEMKNTIECGFGESETIALTLYILDSQKRNDLSWNWVLNGFSQPEIRTVSSPKAIVLAEKDDNTTYAVTFGSAFFLVDKYCDKNFGFDFARKLSFSEIKTTTLTTPSSRRNKTVNTYINYNQLEFDSGESFAKLKAKVDAGEDFTLFKPAIEVGTSIKISTNVETLQNISDIIYYVEDVIENGEEKCKIPVFVKIKDQDYLTILNDRMAESVRERPEIIMPELEIIGADEVFNHNDDEYIIKYRNKSKQVTALTADELRQFCQENNYDYNEVVLDIKIGKCCNGEIVSTTLVRDAIEFIDDQERCLLSKGEWYKFNDDYLSYLSASIAEIPAEYHPEYDFTKAVYTSFINEKYEEEKNSPEYIGQTADTIKKSLESKYYAERAFNNIRENNGYQNFDRQFMRVGTAHIEPMDLYKEGGYVYAVKIGKSSSKLCYAVDQSLAFLRTYKHNELSDLPEVTTIVLWFILERREHIETTAGKPDINELDMFMLKNKLDHWKKEVRLLGFKPLIYINYRTKT